MPRWFPANGDRKQRVEFSECEFSRLRSQRVDPDFIPGYQFEQRGLKRMELELIGQARGNSNQEGMSFRNVD
ncbi:MAG TPA: hypothetical protein VLK23_17115 [Thermodesulfobacteriota bacterium]|nr:hypothetical protein [Thermodesulfobacteriota bacterium]